MASKVIVGHGTLVNTAVNASSGVTIDFGAFQVDRYSRICGLFSASVGSFTFRTQMGPASGTYFVNTTTVVNSGVGLVLDLVNYGRFANLGFTAVVSSQIQAYVYGEVVR